MSVSKQFFTPAEAARRLGISPKTLRLYEERGMIAPVRTEAGWRTYGPQQMARAAEVVGLRKLGLSLAQAADVLDDIPNRLPPILAAHQAALEGEARLLADKAARVAALRAALSAGNKPAEGELARVVLPIQPIASFDLPWPWEGERFDLCEIKPITYITGPLGSGKTRLARKIAETLPEAVFLGLDRTEQGAADSAMLEPLLARLEAGGAERSEALTNLLMAIAPITSDQTTNHAGANGPLVIDMVEDGLNQASQEALIADLRQRGPDARPLFLMTRSTAILDIDSLGPNEAILYCPANHSPPFAVLPYPGAPGYESVENCLATPEVRSRSAGVIAIRPVSA